MPAGAVYVGRGSHWGNPFTVAGAIEHGYASTTDEARKACAGEFRRWLADWIAGEDDGDSDVYCTGNGRYDRRWMRDHLPELRGKTLACWCPVPGPCHGSVLLELSNKPED